MATIGLLYGSSMGNTESAAKTIRNLLGGKDAVSLYEASAASPEAVAKHDKLIIGSSTWGDGDLQDDMESFISDLDDGFFAGKTVALFGLGDQDGYGEYFVNAMGTLYEKVTKDGATVVGEWPVEGYEFEASSAVKKGSFVGLALDEDNQSDLTEERIALWVEQIRGSLS